MKACVYCDSIVEESVAKCPFCSSNRFQRVCPTCGKPYEGATCPDCQAREAAAFKAAEETQKRTEAEAKANKGLAWKTVLTVFMPYVGGFFLINDNVRKGFRYFGIIWCSFLAIYGASLGGAFGTKLFTSLFMMLPFIVYACRKRLWKWNELDSGMRPLAIAFAGVLLVTLVFALVSGGFPSNKAASSYSAASSSAVSSFVAASSAVQSSAVPSPAASSSAASMSASTGTQYLAFNHPIGILFCGIAAAQCAILKRKLKLLGS